VKTERTCPKSCIRCGISELFCYVKYGKLKTRICHFTFKEEEEEEEEEEEDFSRDSEKLKMF
jgi:hypothetical protein